MKKCKLMRKGNQIYRILKDDADRVLVMNCVKRVMPYWITVSEIDGFVDCTEEELCALTDMDMNRELTAKEKRIAQERFTMIAGILPFLTNERERSYMIDKSAGEKSKQTIRNYLCLYLTYQEISVLAPAKKKAKELSRDEKNFRWALNRYYYNSNQLSLRTTYTMLLKEKYSDEQGKLFEEYPAFHQFLYYYRTHKNTQTYLISRGGLSNYQRNHRPLLGDGVQEMASSVGTAMLDSTLLDIFLVDDIGNVVGRPIMTVAIDSYSGMCMGYSLGYNGGIQSLRSLMLNVITDKVEWCKSHGVFIEKESWDCSQMPSTLITDMGSEYTGNTFEQLAELGVKIVNLPPYRPELKGSVEKFFSLIQDLFKQHTKKRGVIEPDFQSRGARDYRLDACLTLAQFEQIILNCIVYYNNNRIIENFPYSQEMIEAGVKPHSRDIYEWGRDELGCNLLDVDVKLLIQTMLSRTTGKFCRNGLRVNGLRYKNKDRKYAEDYLNGREATVAFNADDVSEVWLLEDGEYVPFELIETRFKGKTLETVQVMQTDKRELVQSVQRENLQAQIDLAEHIEVIVGQTKRSDVKLKDIKKNRKREQRKQQIDYTKVV